MYVVVRDCIWQYFINQRILERSHIKLDLPLLQAHAPLSYVLWFVAKLFGSYLCLFDKNVELQPMDPNDFFIE